MESIQITNRRVSIVMYRLKLLLEKLLKAKEFKTRQVKDNININIEICRMQLDLIRKAAKRNRKRDE